jgi:hypothetical protein
MAIRFKRGMSAVGTQYTPDNPCGTAWDWAIPTCWSWLHDAVYAGKYPEPPTPPPVASTLPDGSAIPAVPPDAASPQQVGVNAGQIVQSITDQQVTDTQAQNQSFFESLNNSLNPPPGGSGINWWLVGGIAAGVFALVAIGGGSPRRYGR